MKYLWYILIKIIINYFFGELLYERNKTNTTMKKIQNK